MTPSRRRMLNYLDPTFGADLNQPPRFASVLFSVAYFGSIISVIVMLLSGITLVLGSRYNLEAIVGLFFGMAGFLVSIISGALSEITRALNFMARNSASS